MSLIRRLPFGADASMSVLEHLEELRRRVLLALAGLAVATAVGMWQAERLLRLLMRPAGLSQLVALTVLEPLLVKFKLALVFGLVAAFPWLVFQLMLFVAPALTEREGRYVVPITALFLVLSLVGVIFGYFFILPPSTGWLLAQARTTMSVEVTSLS